MRRLFCARANRDAAFKAAGGTKAGLKKSVTRSQNINPKYVQDSGVGGQPTAFGDETTYFKALYSWTVDGPTPARGSVFDGVRIVQVSE